MKITAAFENECINSKNRRLDCNIKFLEKDTCSQEKLSE